MSEGLWMLSIACSSLILGIVLILTTRDIRFRKRGRWEKI
jgi:hypothetical protein